MLSTPNNLRGPSPQPWTKMLFAVVIIVTLVAGLDPKGYHFQNEVTWLKDGPGLRFGRFGRMHTEPLITPQISEGLNAHGFTIELATTLTNLTNGSFRLLATFHSGDDRSQLLIGQWRQTIVVMNGDDYDHTRKFPRITADIPRTNGLPSLLTITTGPAGTSLYIDGRREAIRGGLHLIMPAAPEAARLTLGSSVHASNPWEADVRGFALEAGPLTRSEVKDHQTRWMAAEDFSFATSDSPLLLYQFGEQSGTTAQSVGQWKVPLEIPAHLWAIGKRALAPLAQHANESRSDYGDTIINLVGFIPFGFTFALMLRRTIKGRRNNIVVVTFAGFLFSLGIELLQAWLPSRDSSMHDLLLNGAGSFLGATLLATVPDRR